jgi:uncharacterized protein YjbI with pentapeptide repeats
MMLNGNSWPERLYSPSIVVFANFPSLPRPVRRSQCNNVAFTRILSRTQFLRTTSHAELSGIWLDGSDLTGANLFGARCVGTSFARCNLRNANLACAHIEGASFRQADLEGADLLYTDV